MDLKSLFNFYTNKEKFMFIMRTPILTDTVSKFIRNAMSDREVFLEVSSSLQLIIEKIINKDPVDQYPANTTI